LFVGSVFCGGGVPLWLPGEGGRCTVWAVMPLVPSKGSVEVTDGRQRPKSLPSKCQNTSVQEIATVSISPNPAFDWPLPRRLKDTSQHTHTPCAPGPWPLPSLWRAPRAEIWPFCATGHINFFFWAKAGGSFIKSSLEPFLLPTLPPNPPNLPGPPSHIH